jgi:hypothetical protein
MTQPKQESETETEFQDIVGYLKAFVSGTTDISSRQWERVATAIETLESKLSTAKSAELTELGK